jgi:hypothetical protein
MASYENNGSAQNELLSDKWYTLKEACKILDISISCSKALRKRGALIVSKRFGKLYVNHYHLQKYLRDGLPAVVSFLVFLSRIGDVCDLIFAS